MALNKTETLILGRLAASRRGRWSFNHGVRLGGAGKPKRWGARLSAAACSLRDKGLVKIVAVESGRDCRAAYSDHYTDVVLELPGSKGG
jgi:hypothetical protein